MGTRAINRTAHMVCIYSNLQIVERGYKRGGGVAHHSAKGGGGVSTPIGVWGGAPEASGFLEYLYILKPLFY